MSPDADVRGDTPAATAPPDLRVRDEAGRQAAMPAWARRLADLYYSGTTSAFVLHGNTHDLVRIQARDDFVTLADYLAEQIFGAWDLVLHYDLARGLRAYAGRDAARLQRMIALAAPLPLGKVDPAAVLPALDQLVRDNVLAEPGRERSIAVLIDHASFVFPAGEPGRMSTTAASQLVTVLNWAASPHVKRLNMAFLLVDERLAALNERLTGNPHVAPVDLALPDVDDREAYIRHLAGDRDLTAFSDYDAPRLAAHAAGISLIDLAVLIRSSIEAGRRLDAPLLRELKKRLIEKSCHGLLEFIEPRWGLDVVIGHEPVKNRLRQDAALLQRGALDSLPMGYLICGPVGTGKTFLANCLSGEMGAPLVVLRNFRSKYVGETEGNLERVLHVLRAMGPVVVVIDEADAALGDRDQEGDSGTSSRVFGMIASQMGDTRYRGRILWMLLTARPDLLPIDLKRQGRAEVHIPLFYPHDEDEVRALFVAMAKKIGVRLDAADVPPVPHIGKLSGADIEGIVGRAWRAARIAGDDHVTPDALARAVADFLPSIQGLEKEMQELAAILECTDREFLPPPQAARLDAEGGRAALQEQFVALKRLLALA